MAKRDIKIIIIDDNIQFRVNLKKYIETKLGYIVIAEASDGVEFLALLNKSGADIILMDIEMQKMDGFEATKLALIQYSYIKIIAITMHNEKIFLIKLIEIGFKGCIFKSNLFDDLDIALKTVMNGGFYFPNNISLGE